MIKKKKSFKDYFEKIDSEILYENVYDKNWNKIEGVYKNDDARKGEEIYYKNGNKKDVTFIKCEKDSSSSELFDNNKKKLYGTYKNVLTGEHEDELYDKERKKLDGTYRKV